MNAISQRLKNAVWFLPPERFAIGFVLYLVVGVIALSAQGTNILQSLLMTLAGGIALTAFLGAVPPMRRFEQRMHDNKPLAWRLLFGPLRRSEDEASPLRQSSGDNSDPPNSDMKPDDEPSSGVVDEKFRRRMRANQIDSAKRAWLKMQDKVIHTGLVVAVFMVGYWFAADSIADFFKALFGGGGASAGMFGAQVEISFKTPKELFIFDLWVIAILWFALIVFLPRWLIYIMLIGMAGMRITFLVFGPMASIMVMNMGQLPFLYGLMMFFMFGSIIYPFLRQVKSYRPGEGTWETPKGSMRGQPEARAIVDTEMAKMEDYIAGKSKRRPENMLFDGPPGTGKTLLAKEIATEYTLPFIMCDGAALAGAPLLNLIIEYWLKPRAHSLADEYNGVLFFIDEAETLFQARQGMMGGGQMGGMGMSGPQSEEIRDVWDLFPYDSIGATTSCGVLYDSAQARERFWNQKSPLSLGKAPKTYAHPFFMPMGMGGGGGQAVLPFLTWMDGIGSPPATESFKRRIANNFLDGLLFIPPNVPYTQIPLRFSPAKPKKYNVLFIGATNRAFMIDPAILRKGRMGLPVRFKAPDLESRKDIIDRYAKAGVRGGLLRPELLSKKATEEFARATNGLSPAEIEAVINTSYDVRGTHLKNMKRIKALLDSGVAPRKILDQDKKYWLRNKNEMRKKGWDDDRADMRSLLEARNTLIYGKADPGLTTSESRDQTAMHEYWGHFLILKAALGDLMRPSVISVMPRGNALGMVSHIPIEERDPKPQRFYEGMLRVSVGSIVAERFFFGENQPGVSGDLENATRIACFIVGKVGMPPYDCSEEDRKKFAELGETLIAVPDGANPFMNPMAQGFVEKVLSNPGSRGRVAIMLGQAFVDDYRFIRANVVKDKDHKFHKGVVGEILRLDELGGAKLELVWKELDERLILWHEFTDEQRSWWPDNITHIKNYFYDPSRKPEVEEVLAS